MSSPSKADPYPFPPPMAGDFREEEAWKANFQVKN